MSRSPLEEALFVDRAARNPDAPVSPFIAMQRVVVRMLFDPAFVNQIYDDSSSSLAGLDLDPVLVKQLRENDRRLWNADHLRRSRSLKILMEEFKVTATLALAETRRIAFLEAFFASPFFHEAVQKRKYMALSFVSYIEAAADRGQLNSVHLRAALGLEAAMALSRRVLRDARRGCDAALARVAPGRPGLRWLAQPGVACHFPPDGTIALVQHIEKYLFQVSQVPALALCDDAPRPDPLPALGEKSSQPVLLEPEPGGKVELSDVGEPYARVIAACARPVDDEHLAAAVSAHGINACDAREMTESLLGEGVLRRVKAAGDGTIVEARGA